MDNLSKTYSFLSTSQETAEFLREALKKVHSIGGIFLVEDDGVKVLMAQINQENREEFDCYPFLHEGYSRIDFRKEI